MARVCAMRVFVLKFLGGTAGCVCVMMKMSFGAFEEIDNIVGGGPSFLFWWHL